MDPFVALAIAIFPDIVGMVLANPSDDIRNKISQAVMEATATTAVEDARAKLNDPRQAAVVVDLKDRLKKIASGAGVSLMPVGAAAAVSAPDASGAQAGENTQKAREKMLSLATINESQVSTPAIISYIVVVGFIALVFMLVTGHAPGLQTLATVSPVNREIAAVAPVAGGAAAAPAAGGAAAAPMAADAKPADDHQEVIISPNATLSQVANICIGALATSFATVLNFWLGSSLGSRRKDAPAAQASTVDQNRKINQS